MRLLLVEGLVLGDLSVGTIRRVTAKELYQSNITSFPPPKVIPNRESIIHNIVPNRERLFSKMHLVNSPNCMVCGLRESNTHIFTECLMVREAWGWVRMRMLELLPEENARCSNFEMINLMFWTWKQFGWWQLILSLFGWKS